MFVLLLFLIFTGLSTIASLVVAIVLKELMLFVLAGILLISVLLSWGFMVILGEIDNIGINNITSTNNIMKGIAKLIKKP